MPTSGLRIDTSVVGIAGPSSSHSSSRNGGLTPGSSKARSAKSIQRMRSASSASASSSTSNPLRILNNGFTSSARPVPQSSSSETAFVESDPSTWSPTDTTSTESGQDACEYVLAMHDFIPQQQNVTCLAFAAGQIIRVLNRDGSGWWDGEVDGRRGWFPSNYVTSDVSLLTEEELPRTINARNGKGHTQQMSTASAASWTSTSSSSSSPSSKRNSFTRTDHRPMASESSMDTYCPPLMVPLLHAITLLQNAVRGNRPAHFQPSAACIISCVRTILSEVGCLPREAEILKKHEILARERKRILSDLTSLVNQAKKASEAELGEQQRQLEVEGMVRLGGQLFAHVRGLLAIAVQCGVSIQPSSRSHGSERGSVDTEGRWGSQEGTLVRSDDDAPLPENYDPQRDSVGGTTNGIEHRRRQRDLTSAQHMRAKSLSDLKHGQKGDKEQHLVPKPQLKSLGRTAGKQMAASHAKRFTSAPATHHRSGQLSVSSVSSSSSFSSGESVGMPPTPVFPSGPSTTPEVMEALRHTHDHYLSTIAAFIGHAHSHSRTSHASSTGHMYDLVREVVEMVCKLLTIVEAILRHSDIPVPRANDLRLAKEGLYNVTSTLADSVRQLTTSPLPGMTEEEEKATLLRSATNALKAGADCVNAAKRCLQRAAGEKSLIIELPSVGEVDPSSYTPSKFSHHAREGSGRLRVVTGGSALDTLYRANGLQGEEEDLTIQAQTASFDIDTPTKGDKAPNRTDLPNLETLTVNTEAPSDTEDEVWSPAPDVEKPLPPVQANGELASLRSTSPVSFVPTDDGTTWEGAHSLHRPQLSLEEKLRHGDLPTVPEGSLPDVPRPDPLTWLLSHDYAPDDVAYNSDGQLVGASLTALVERMTPHDSLVEPAFAAVFFLTFRQFTTPTVLVEALISRYNIFPPPGLTEADTFIWQQQKGLPVRLRVSNFIKSWLESYWRPGTDNNVLASLLAFTRDALAMMFPLPSQRIVELIMQWTAATQTGISPKVDRIRDAGIPLNPPSAVLGSEIPRPIMTKAVLSALRSKNFAAISVTDFDPLELARQLTAMECTLYCAIQPEEVLETGQTGGIYPGNVKMVTSLSTVITGWVAECILNEPDTKRRTALVKFFIKIADRCASLQNFSTPRSILAALDSSTISRLSQTWTGLPQKNRLQLDSLRKLADHARNYHEYRSRLRNTAPPAVPFLGLYLTDITFCREGNPSHRASPKNPEKKLLNFNKYHKLARIVQDMQRFQVSYNLKEIPEVQEYLKESFEQSKNRTDLQDLYRRSLLVEPKRPADTPPSGDMRQLFQWATRGQQTTPTSAS